MKSVLDVLIAVLVHSLSNLKEKKMVLINIAVISDGSKGNKNRIILRFKLL